jgi:Uma2 family endonuclease
MIDWSFSKWLGAPMPIVIQQEHDAVQIPDWVHDICSFRRWAKSDDFPQRGWYAHLGGNLWVDPSMEKLGHNQVKTEVCIVLGSLVKQDGSGRFLSDRMLLTNMEAELSTEPDGMFLTFSALREGRVRLEQGDDSLEVEGSPDMVLEVVSPTSVKKDTKILRELYWRAGIREYWLIDPRRDETQFEILKYGPRGFLSVKKHGPWLKSPVFGRSFRLVREMDPLGKPIHALSVQ